MSVQSFPKPQERGIISFFFFLMEEGMSNKYIAQGHAISKWQSCDKMYN